MSVMGLHHCGPVGGPKMLVISPWKLSRRWQCGQVATSPPSSGGLPSVGVCLLIPYYKDPHWYQIRTHPIINNLILI